MKITPKNQPVRVEALISLLYGEPGIGKTSLALTAKNPLLIDLEGGAARAITRADSGSPATWDEFMHVLTVLPLGYDTIVIDSFSEVVTLAYDSLIGKNKNEKGKIVDLYDVSAGAPTLSGYSVGATLLKNLVNRLKAIKLKGLDIIMIAHPKTAQKQNKTQSWDSYKPNASDSVLGAIMATFDLVGYVHQSMDGRVVAFAPDATYVAKDPAQLGTVAIEDITRGLGGDQMARILDQVKTKLSHMGDLDEAAQRQLEDAIMELDACTGAQGLTLFVKNIGDYPDAIKPILKDKLVARANALQCRYSKEIGGYESIS